MPSEKDTPKRTRIPRQPKPPFRDFRDDQYTVTDIWIEHQKLMARVIITWAKCEAALHALIWALVNLSEDDGRILTKSMGAKLLIPVAKALAQRHLSGNNKDDLLDALSLADQVREDRDFIAHGVWTTLMPDTVPLASSIRPTTPEGTVGTETFPADRMHAIIAVITKAKDGITRVVTALDASRGKPDEPPPHGLSHRAKGHTPDRPES